MGWSERISSDIVPPTLYHAVGQAALALEVRSNDLDTKRIIQGLTHQATDWKCRAERACLRVLEGGCSVPVGTVTALDDSGILTMTGTITSLNGDQHVEQTRSRKIQATADAETLGEEVARALIETGGREILDDVGKDRVSRQAMETKLLGSEPVS